MTRTAILTALALAATAPAYAYTGASPSMVSSVGAILSDAGMSEIDVTSLSDEQVVEIFAAGQPGDANEKNLKIQSALNGEGYSTTITERRLILTDMDEMGLMPAGASSIVVSVQNFLDANGYEADASTLTDEQVAEIYFFAFSGSEMDNGGENKIDTILNM